ncbi:hypothetical protein ANI01nite_14320 [Glutamicibacter nicotianae]|uniref:Uncharacterized protein n=1 Tax=Glutamicibacter nicotianae TaxID=37929 RepID=A0ABQ0RK89_GLUNI|nr:hypothetical protein ANI01nite_14320 [Glutamicibacter nicotianae]
MHIGQPLRGEPMFGLDLRGTVLQVLSNLFRGGSLIQDQGNLFQAETQLAQGHYLMQALKLGRVVGTVAAERVYVGGLEHPGGIPVPQHAVGHLADLRKRPDG